MSKIIEKPVLVLLDLSSAFDTVDHEILLERLQTRFGFTGKVLKRSVNILFVYLT